VHKLSRPRRLATHIYYNKVHLIGEYLRCSSPLFTAEFFKLQKMSSTSDVDQEDLCSASRDGDVALVSQLLANHSFDADDATAALDQAGLNLTIIRLLLQHGADVNTFHLPMTPLSKAPGELLRLLAEYGYDFKSDGHRILQSVSIVVSPYS
jgi:hypothetical protein